MRCGRPAVKTRRTSRLRSAHLSLPQYMLRPDACLPGVEATLAKRRLERFPQSVCCAPRPFFARRCRRSSHTNARSLRLRRASVLYALETNDRSRRAGASEIPSRTVLRSLSNAASGALPRESLPGDARPAIPTRVLPRAFDRCTHTNARCTNRSTRRNLRSRRLSATPQALRSDSALHANLRCQAARRAIQAPLRARSGTVRRECEPACTRRGFASEYRHRGEFCERSHPHSHVRSPRGRADARGYATGRAATLGAPTPSIRTSED